MKLDVNDKYNFILEEVYNPIILKTKDNEELVISMRDSGFEIIYNNQLYSLQKGVITNLSTK